MLRPPPPPPNAFYNYKKNLDLKIHFIDHLFLKVVETRFPELAVSLLYFSSWIPLDTSLILLHNKDNNAMHFVLNNSLHTANLLIGYTMTLEIPVNVNTTLNQKRLPVIPGFTSLYEYKKRPAFSHFRKFLQNSNP